MRFKNVLAAVAAVSMAAVPAVAAPTSASKLSVSNAVKVPASARTSATRGKAKAAPAIIIGIIAALAVVGGIVVIADEGDSN